MRRAVVFRAAAVAATVSGAPSTAWALLRGEDPLAATYAAGRLVRPDAKARWELVAAAVVAHVCLSIGWTAAVARLIPRDASTQRAAAVGAAAGLGIAALDLGVAHVVASPRLAATGALPVLPQVADHLAFGVVVGWVLSRVR